MFSSYKICSLTKTIKNIRKGEKSSNFYAKSVGSVTVMWILYCDQAYNSFKIRMVLLEWAWWMRRLMVGTTKKRKFIVYLILVLLGFWRLYKGLLGVVFIN